VEVIMSLITQARSIVALDVVAGAINGQDILREDYPQVGEEDWNQIVAEALLIAANTRPQQEEVELALMVLATRADTEE
jgi:hypothetical protein